MFFSKNSPYDCQRTREQTQANLGADAVVSGGRDERVWEQMRPRLPPDSLTGIGSRRIDLKALEADCNVERMASALESRALKIQRKSSLAVAPSQRKFALRQHNHLLRRQHCSSLCSQSEGHEHVANLTNALRHDFVGFSARAWPPQYSPPSLCEQSELQCFASDLCQMSARCPLQRCRIPLFPWLRFFLPLQSSPVFSFHDSSPLSVSLFPVFPHPPVPSYYNRVFLLFL